MKKNNIIVVPHTRIILLSLFSICFFLFMSLGKFSYFLLCKVERHLQTLYLLFCTAGNGDWWVNGTVYFDVGRNVTGASRTVRGELVVGVSESQVHPMVEITSDKPYAHFGVMVSRVRSIPSIFAKVDSKVKVGVLRPVQQPGSYWDRSSAFAICGSRTHTEVTACD